MKVSDEFTVPLCSVHHDAIHRTSDEERWWARQAIDPLKAAASLWATSVGRDPGAALEEPRNVATEPSTMPEMQEPQAPSPNPRGSGEIAGELGREQS